ncbi:HpcH/HpaI aldolase family protein [Ramlibacter sp.]|uniref:HpcH/HpaI aldolase family protein n=1 Tax=Ramlibacter sp. TaxID=1917967 RepID=UPI003D0FB908
MLKSLKSRCEAQGFVLNGYVTMPSPASTELYSRQGWDCVTLDMEHGSIGFDAAVELLRAIAGSGVVPLARVPRADPTWVSTLLDAGVMGITAAMIDTAEEARRLVAACRYPPRGTRGLSRQCRAAMIYGPDYTQSVDDDLTVFAMVETYTSLANLEEIVAVDGLDGIYFGGVDYDMSLRRPEAPASAPAVAEARRRVADACKRHGLIAGMNASTPAAAKDLLKEGFRFITLSSDAAAMTTQARNWIAQTRELAGQ